MSLLNSKRHSYLVRGFSCVKNFSPRMVTRFMDKEFAMHTTWRNLEPPLLPMASSIPVIYSPNVDPTRAKLGFGRWALPKLKRQVHHEDIFEVMKALNSIHDLVHNPEKAFEAIKIGLVDRLMNMMLHERDFVREKICLIFYALAGLEVGRRVIVRRYKLLRNLALLLDDPEDAVRYKAQLVVEMISLSPTAAAALNCADYLFLILRLLGGSPKTQDEKTIVFHLATLKMLLESDVKEEALRHNAMNILLEKADSENEKIKALALDCIALLCHCPAGRAEAADKDVGVILCKKLFDPSMEVKAKVAGALAFATIQSDMRKKLCKKCTVEVLVKILENFHNSEGQMMAMKVLSNLSEEPEGKSLVKSMKVQIRQVFTGNDKEVERHKKMLIYLLKKK